MKIAEASGDGVRVMVYQEDDVYMDPRKEWDNLGTMICWHKRYDLGDDHGYPTPGDFLTEFSEELATEEEKEELVQKVFEEVKNDYEEDEWDALLEELRDGGAFGSFAAVSHLWDIIDNHAVVLPIYIYDHSGITISTGSFSCPWDSGQVGWIYITEDVIKKELSSPHTEDDWERAKQILESEVRVYDYYLTGQIYGFSVEKTVKCEHCGAVEEEIIDSCGGFYGELGDVIEDMKEQVEEQYHPLFDSLEVLV